MTMVAMRHVNAVRDRLIQPYGPSAPIFAASDFQDGDYYVQVAFGRDDATTIVPPPGIPWRVQGYYFTAPGDHLIDVEVAR